MHKKKNICTNVVMTVYMLHAGLSVNCRRKVAKLSVCLLGMVDIQETRFDIRKGCVMQLSVLYMHFHPWRGCVRMVAILETYFLCRKGCVGMVDLLEKDFEIRKGCV